MTLKRLTFALAALLVAITLLVAPARAATADQGSSRTVRVAYPI